MSAAGPRVTVVLPVYNGEPYLREAIDSILAQTLTELELVIVENGSSDGSRDTARAAARRDGRISLLEHPTPLGIVGAANAGAAAARAPLVARQDQDDVSHPSRLERQVAALDEAPDAVAVGTLSEGIDSSGRRIRPRDRWRLIGRRALPPFPHGSVCLRRSAFERVGGYREGTHHWEDVDLFLRLVSLGPVLVLPEALYRYRFHARSLTASNGNLQDDGEALVWQAVEEFRRGADWDHLLDASATGPPSARIAARVSRHQDGLRLWSELPPDSGATGRGATLPAAARLRRAWQRASPETLRKAVCSAIVLRDLAASPFLRGQRAVAWRPR